MRILQLIPGFYDSAASSSAISAEGSAIMAVTTAANCNISTLKLWLKERDNGVIWYGKDEFPIADLADIEMIKRIDQWAAKRFER